jgi:hypothetical protein
MRGFPQGQGVMAYNIADGFGKAHQDTMTDPVFPPRMTSTIVRVDGSS